MVGLGTPLASQDREMGVPSLAVYCRGPALISGRAAKVDQNSSCSRGLNNQRFTIRTSRQRFFTRNPAYRFYIWNSNISIYFSFIKDQMDYCIAECTAEWFFLFIFYFLFPLIIKTILRWDTGYLRSEKSFN